MNHSILLTVKKPDESSVYTIRQSYDNFVHIVEDTERQKRGLRMLTEGCVLLPLDKGLQDVLDVLKALGNCPYTYTILNEDMKWHEGTSTK